jgi:Uma2 family endonuclease
MTARIDLPSDGMITRADFEALPRPVRGWAWELLAPGRLRLTHMPITVWHSRIVLTALEYWRGLGYEIAGEQYVADSGFVRGGDGRNSFVADGVVFAHGYSPAKDSSTHDGADIHTVIEAVSQDSEERDAREKLDVYASLGIQHYWIVRGDTGADTVDGLITMYELGDGEYKLVGNRLVSQPGQSEG